MRYSKNLRGTSSPSLRTHQVPPSPMNSTTSPFENQAAARQPFLITMSSTVASRNDVRNARVGGVQLGN